METSVHQGFVRRHLVQIAALAVAVVAVAVLAVVAFRPSSGGGGEVRSPVTSRPTATADPRVAEVKAVARRYLEAFWESAKTGDTSAVDALTEKDSQAYSNAAVGARISKSAHHNFIALRVDIGEGDWAIDVLSEHASVTATYRLFGHDADWPSLVARETDHETAAYQVVLEMRSNGQKWVIYQST